MSCRREGKCAGRERGRKNVSRDERGARREQQRDSVAAHEFAHSAGFHGLTSAVHTDAFLGLQRDLFCCWEQKTQEKQDNLLGATVGRVGEGLREDALSGCLRPRGTGDQGVFIGGQSTGLVPEQAGEVPAERAELGDESGRLHK